MDNADQKALNNYFTKSINGNKFDVNIELKDEDDDTQSVKNGKEIIKDSDNSDNDSDDSEESDESDESDCQ